MKLKYFLRGLGTGILFATIVLFISYSYRMSDSQIKKQAEELGMVYAGATTETVADDDSSQESGTGKHNSESKGDYNEENSTLEAGMTTVSESDNTSETITTTVAGENNTSETITTTVADEGNTSETATTTVTEEGNTSETTTKSEVQGTTTAQPTTKSEVQGTTAVQPTTKSEVQGTTTEQTTTKPVSQEETTTGNIEKCEITVTGSTVSYDVAYALQVAGIVENADEFDNYLRSNGYSIKIQNGTYTITSDMSFKEIAETICEKKY